MTVFMPPFIMKLKDNADKIDSVVPGMKREIMEIYTKLNFSTFDTRPKRRGDDGIEDVDPKEVFSMMLEMADFFEKSGGIIPEEVAADDDHRADFIAFIKEKRGSIPVESMVDAFINEKIRPLLGNEPDYFEYIKKLVTPIMAARKSMEEP
jgi:hypothetical protein